MKKTIFLSTAILIISFFSACNKNHEASSAEISIVEPMEFDTILQGDELHVQGSITANGTMHGYTLTVANAANDSVSLFLNTDSHADSYSFHEHWLNNVTDTTIMKVIIEATLNHEGTKTSKMVNVVCLP